MQINLYCIVLGEKNPFPVTMDWDRSVGELKDEIKKKKEPEFNHLAADKLTLYKISVDISNVGKYERTMDEVSQSGYVFNPKVKLLPMEELG